jgi:hypothetical protein
MHNEFKKVEVAQPWYVWRTEGGAETGNKFNRPTSKRRYVRILALCLIPLPAKVIFPNTKHPLMHQVRDMCRAGLLERYKCEGKPGYYYKTTPAGFDLLAKAVSVK